MKELFQKGLSRCLSNTVDSTDGGHILWIKGRSAKPRAHGYVHRISSIILAGFKFSRICGFDKCPAEFPDVSHEALQPFLIKQLQLENSCCA